MNISFFLPDLCENRIFRQSPLNLAGFWTYFFMTTNSSTERPDQPVTLQMIADRAGVTRALVSMALRNSPKVAATTRERLQSLAKEMGYRPNPMVRALMTSVRQQRTDTYRATLAFVTNLRSKDSWRELAVYPEYFTGACERGAELGYKVEHFWLGEYKGNSERFEKILHARGVPGLLFAPLAHGQHSIDLDLSHFSAVTLGYSMITPSLSRIANHYVQTVQDAVRQLSARGYRRIGFALNESDICQVGHLWLAGALIAARCQPEVEMIHFSPPVWTQDVFREWFRQKRPEVIIGVTKEMWEWTRQLGPAIPAELGFLHLDCPTDEVFSGMYQNTRRLGEEAIEMLAHLVERNIICSVEEPRMLLFNSEYRKGQTLRTLPA